MNAGDLTEFVEHFRHRTLQDALNEATSDYWLHRAEQIEAARPRPGEYHGKATNTDLAARYDDLSAIAEACRHRASLSLGGDDDDVRLIADALAEVS